MPNSCAKTSEVRRQRTAATSCAAKDAATLWAAKDAATAVDKLGKDKERGKLISSRKEVETLKRARLEKKGNGKLVHLEEDWPVRTPWHSPGGPERTPRHSPDAHRGSCLGDSAPKACPPSKRVTWADTTGSALTRITYFKKDDSRAFTPHQQRTLAPIQPKVKPWTIRHLWRLLSAAPSPSLKKTYKDALLSPVPPQLLAPMPL